MDPGRLPDVIRLSWLGHATVVIDLGGVRLLTDPLLRPHAGLLRRVGRAPRAEDWAGAAAVLVSHLHSDHASLPSLRMLDGVPLVSGPANAAWLSRRLPNRVVAMSDGDWTTVSAGPDQATGATHTIEVGAVRAVHGHRPMPHRPNDTHGFLLRSESAVVYFAGDTSLYDDMAGLPALAGRPVDVALLPIAGWGPRLSGGHMGPPDAAEACRMMGARAVLPIHHGTLHPSGHHLVGLEWMDRPAGEFARDLARVAPDCRLLAPSPGDVLELP